MLGGHNLGHARTSGPSPCSRRYHVLARSGSAGEPELAGLELLLPLHRRPRSGGSPVLLVRSGSAEVLAAEPVEDRAERVSASRHPRSLTAGRRSRRRWRAGLR